MIQIIWLSLSIRAGLYRLMYQINLAMFSPDWCVCATINSITQCNYTEPYHFQNDIILPHILKPLNPIAHMY